MSNRLTLTVIVALFASADVPGGERLRPPANAAKPSFSSSDEISIFPTAVSTRDDAQAQAAQTQAKGGALQDSSKLELIRYVSGEFAKATKALPAGKEGFLVYAGQPLMVEQLDRAVARHGAAVNTGDKVQITKLEFKDHTIVVDVNGGGRGKHSWRDHLSIGMGGGLPMPTSTTTTTQENGPAGVQPGMGSTIFLEFNKTIPDMAPEDLKKMLAPLMDFAKQRSASLQWFDTLPPEMKKAIQERRPAVGMDREEVVAAMGKPEHKVRERDNDGNDIEDWIYGQPPSKTVFVRFMSDRVTSIKQYPQ
ncbi:MAG TPA: hypothetical protein VGI16_15335 [Candidatus Acidoferrum sp.]|jgi:hypothetical protein